MGKWFTLHRNIKRHMNGWLAISLMGAAVILLPIVYVMLSLFRPPNENWMHVKQYLLLDYVIGSITLVSFTALLATFLGVTLAWLVVGYSFPFSRFFRWALILPLSLPPYIAAFTYRTMTGYTGFIQSMLRNEFGILLPPDTIEVMSMRGAIFILTLCLFPYVFMITRTYLERQSGTFIENAVLLGRKRFSLFFQVVLPISRPAIIGGMMLVVFEGLSDYGVARYFGVQTISTAIFQTWFGMYDVDSALRLAAWLLVAVVGVFVIERFLRRNRQFYATTGTPVHFAPRKLRGAASVLAVLFCSIVFFLSFLLPVGQIIVWTTWTYRKVWTPTFIEMTMNSFSGAFIATALIIVFSVITARVCRRLSSSFSDGLTRFITAGYAVPGAIIAIGVLAVYISLDQQLSPLYASMGLEEGALVLSLSLAMLITGYVIRFMATGMNSIEAGYSKIARSYSEASLTLGRGFTRTFFKVELPLLKGAILTGFVLTFVEIVKELPLTMLLRPFNFETLSTQTYKYAIDERIYEAALPSLLLIGLSLASVLAIHQLGKKENL